MNRITQKTYKVDDRLYSFAHQSITTHKTQNLKRKTQYIITHIYKHRIFVSAGLLASCVSISLCRQFQLAGLLACVSISLCSQCQLAGLLACVLTSLCTQCQIAGLLACESISLCSQCQLAGLLACVSDVNKCSRINCFLKSLVFQIRSVL